MANNLGLYNNPIYESSSRDEDVRRSIWFEMYNLTYMFVEWACDTNKVDEDAENFAEILNSIRNDEKIHEEYEDYRYESTLDEYYR